jgi:hypothetical protein
LKDKTISEKNKEYPYIFRLEGSPGAAHARPVAETPDAALAA